MFVDESYLMDFFKDKRVVFFGSAPNALNNKGNEINKYDIIVRANNYKTAGLGDMVGKRTDVHYSFYGSSIRKSRGELIDDGVKLCMCKCPNSKPIKSEWHEKNNMSLGVDFRYIYKNRREFWFCDTFIPSDERFIKHFELMDKHIPTTGFSGLLDIIDFSPSELYITGFDFFRSNVHNINERWKKGRPDDPIKHEPENEAMKLKELTLKHSFIKLDEYLKRKI